MWELFNTTLLVEVEVAILKYGSSLHLLKSSVRRRKKSLHARARSPNRAGRGEERAAPAWMVRRNPASRLAGARSPFAVLVFGFSAFKLQSSKRLQIKSSKNDLDRDRDTMSVG
jgi:hypothetical protein